MDILESTTIHDRGADDGQLEAHFSVAVITRGSGANRVVEATQVRGEYESVIEGSSFIEASSFEPLPPLVDVLTEFPGGEGSAEVSIIDVMLSYTNFRDSLPGMHGAGGTELMEKFMEDMGSAVPNWHRGATRQCWSVNPASSPALGYRRSQKASGFAASSRGGVPRLGPGSINAPDMFAYCLCQGGKTAKQVANMMGHSCAANSEWAKRMRCLVNPYNPDDSVKRECVEYLMEDNGLTNRRRTLGEICEARVQCPPHQTLAASIIGGVHKCTCRGGSGPSRSGSGGSLPAECRVVDCQAPGLSSDMRSQCCPNPIPGPMNIPRLR